MAINRFKKQGLGMLINIGLVDSEIPLAYHSVYARLQSRSDEPGLVDDPGNPPEGYRR